MDAALVGAFVGTVALGVMPLVYAIGRYRGRLEAYGEITRIQRGQVKRIEPLVVRPYSNHGWASAVDVTRPFRPHAEILLGNNTKEKV